MFQIGDIVWIDKELHDTQEHIVGKIMHITKYFTQIKTDKGTLYTVHVTDSQYMHLIRKFSTYSEEAKQKDIREALSKH